MSEPYFTCKRRVRGDFLASCSDEAAEERVQSAFLDNAIRREECQPDGQVSLEEGKENVVLIRP